MTPAERTAALEIIGWSQRELAVRTGFSESGLRKLMAKKDLWFDGWLKAVALFITHNPPPERV